MEKSDLLYGRWHTQGLVGLHEFGDNEIVKYIRTEEDEVKTKKVEFRPFGHFTEDACEKLLDGYNVHEVRKLSGPGEKNRLVRFETYHQFWSAYGWIKSEVERSEYDMEKSFPTQYLMWSGETLFGGMRMNDIHRMQVDLEVYSSVSQFPNAEREGDEIIIISITDNRGREILLHTSQEARRQDGHDDQIMRCVGSERRLLQEFVRTVHRYDPDVLEFHNGFGFDLPYLNDRADYLSVSLALGRDNTEPNTFKASKDFAERTQQYTNFIISGRSVVDSYFMAADFDVFARDLPSYGLKDLAQYFGFASDERTYVDGERISEVWDTEPLRLLDYALDDVRDTKSVVEKLGNSTFELTKILPATYQEVLTLGTAGSIEILMRREYIERKEAVPLPEEPDPPAGGYTEVFKRGTYHDLAYADVSSLYPSNMLLYGVSPDSDSLGIFRPLLKQLTEMRLKTKKEMRSLDDGRRKDTLDAQQQAYKVLINSFYGALGFEWFAWNDFDDAAKVTRKGRKILKRLIHVIKDEGGEIVLCDTDGVMFTLPEGAETDEEVDALIGQTISDQLPEGIEIDNDGRFDTVVSYKRKNYGKVPRGESIRDMDLAGNSLIGRGLEPFLRKYIRYQMYGLAKEDVSHLYETHDYFKNAIWKGEVGIDMLKKRGRLKKTMQEYADSPVRQARYEVAKDWAEKTGETPKAGDTFWYYISGSGDDYKVYQKAKLIEDYTNGDENRYHYLQRLDATADIFRDMVTGPKKVFHMNVSAHEQKSLFSQEPDLSGVEVVNKDVRDLPPNPSDEEIATTHSL